MANNKSARKATDQPIFDAKIAYIYSDVPSYVRVRRTLPVLRRLFREVHFIGATRGTTWDDSRTKGIHYHITDLRMGHGLQTIPKVAMFFRTIRYQLKKIKPDVVVAVNDEYALPFVLGYFPRPQFLAVDLFDSIAMRILGKGRYLNPFWRRVSEFGLKHIDGLVEVIEERLEWHRHTPPVTQIIYNTPEITDDITPKTGLPDHFVYVNGTLSDNIHGIESIVGAIDKVPEMHIVTTGKFLGDFVQNVFLKHPKVVSLGKVHPSEILEILAAADAVYCHYNPSQLNYQYGAPNKLYEGMMLGKPVLINSENHASSIIREHGFGLISPYNDVDALANDLRTLIKGTPELKAGCEKAKTLFRETYAWDLMEDRWKDFFRRMGVPENA